MVATRLHSRLDWRPTRMAPVVQGRWTAAGWASAPRMLAAATSRQRQTHPRGRCAGACSQIGTPSASSSKQQRAASRAHLRTLPQGSRCRPRTRAAAPAARSASARPPAVAAAGDISIRPQQYSAYVSRAGLQARAVHAAPTKAMQQSIVQTCASMCALTLLSPATSGMSLNSAITTLRHGKEFGEAWDSEHCRQGLYGGSGRAA